MKQYFWIGTVDWNGYTLHVVSQTEQGAQNALFREYRKQQHRATDFEDWESFASYFGPWIQKAELDQVVWP